MANEKRGEVDLVLGDRKLVLRFSLGAMRELKQRFNKPVSVYLQEKGTSVDEEDVVALFAVGLKHGSGEIPEADLFDLMDMPHMPYYSEILAKALSAANTGETKAPTGKAAPDRPFPTPKTPTQ